MGGAWPVLLQGLVVIPRHGWHEPLWVWLLFPSRSGDTPEAGGVLLTLGFWFCGLLAFGGLAPPLPPFSRFTLVIGWAARGGSRPFSSLLNAT